MSSHPKVYPTAPDFDEPVHQPPVNQSRPINNSIQNSGNSGGYVPQTVGESYAKPQFQAQRPQEQMFHIQPFPGPQQTNHQFNPPQYYGPPPNYSQQNHYAPNFNGPPPYHNVAYGPQPTNTVLIDRNAFDSGARFSQGARPTIPPPPPGVMAHPAQIAQASGHQVILGKKKKGFFFQHGAGSTFW